MAKVNAKLFALKYKLLKKLTDSLNKDKELIKEGAEITFKNYCKIQIVECTKASYSKEDQKKLDEYAKANLISKQITHFKRIDIDNIPIEVDSQVDEIFNTLENSQNKTIQKVASKVANKSK